MLIIFLFLLICNARFIVYAPVCYGGAYAEGRRGREETRENVCIYFRTICFDSLILAIRACAYLSL